MTLASTHGEMDWTLVGDGAMDVVVVTNQEQAAIEAALNALQVAVLLAARMDADQAELRCAIERAVAELATLKPKAEQR